ncbi:hypothetical protein SAY86_027510 [Trapa natans]|uniref:RNA helicase n=1 Tax=Trapa natans TaxID=22666 RepID=A0AAN7KT61_TRANT|nr:hypothetical protein SAY86_027510 [Trapa natans]
MGERGDNDAYEEELLDYEDEEEKVLNSAAKVNGDGDKKGYVGIHSSGFRDFLLKPELLRAIVDSGFEHPSEVQHECIPQAILGMDVICQAKSGMGKTAVFVLSTLQQIEPVAGQVVALVLGHTRELAYQICHEFERFSTYLPDIKVAVFYGGVNIKIHKDLLKNECPHIVVGTPGRILALARDKDLPLKNVRHFILDECDKMLESLDMRRDVQEIFKLTPHDKQVMMFSATLSKEIRPVCKKFMQDVMFHDLYHFNLMPICGTFYMDILSVVHLVCLHSLQTFVRSNLGLFISQFHCPVGQDGGIGIQHAWEVEDVSMVYGSAPLATMCFCLSLVSWLY